MKRTAIFAFALLLICSTFSSMAFITSDTTSASSTAIVPNGTYKITYENIPSIVSSNLDIIKAKTNVAITQENWVDYNDQLNDLFESYDEVIETYDALIDTYLASVDSNPALTPELIQAQTEALIEERDAKLESIQESIDSVYKARDTVQIDVASSVTQVMSVERASVNSAQQAFLSHYALIQEGLAAQNQYENLEWQISIAKKKLANELISQDEYDKLVNQLPTLDLAIKNNESEMRQCELRLKTAVGFSLSTVIEMGSLPSIDLSRIETMDRETDRQQYINYSYSVRSAKESMDKAQLVYNQDRSVQKSKLSLDAAIVSYEQAVEQAAREFEISYDTLKDTYNSYITSQKDLETQTSDLNKLKKKYEKGQSSQNAVRKASDALYQSECKLASSKINLFYMWQEYQNSLSI